MADHRYEHIFRATAEEFDLPVDVVKLVFNAAWDFVRQTTRTFNFNNVQSQDELIEMKTSFHFPGLGKLYASYDKIEKRRNREEWWRKNFAKDYEDKEDKADVHVSSDDNG